MVLVPSSFRSLIRERFHIQLLDLEVATLTWETQLVFAERGEAEEYAHRRAYNYPDWWRVHCVPCKGILASTLS